MKPYHYDEAFFLIYIYNMIDRKVAPEFNSLIEISLPPLNSFKLQNGQTVYFISNSNLEVFRLEIVFRAGSYFGDKYGASYFTSKMLLGGTSSKASAELIESFDKFGGFLEISQNFERLQVVLHGLNRYFENYLPHLIDLIYNSIFPKEELDIQKNISNQSFLVNNEKASFEASSIFKKNLYGEDHFLGKTLNSNEIDVIENSDIIDFYTKQIAHSEFDIFLSGNVSDKELAILDSYFSQNENLKKGSKSIVLPEIMPTFNVSVSKLESLQTSIRMGKRLINRKHPDFYKFIVFNTLFGGYFGSRLMTNIREEKGYTYGISSSLVPLASDGYFVIGSDVKKEFAQNTIDEIFKEIEILKTQKVEEEELSLVKSYMTGSILGSTNTVFDIIDKHKSVYYEQLNPNFYNELLPNIMSISAHDIQYIANTYMSDLSIVCVG